MDSGEGANPAVVVVSRPMLPEMPGVVGLVGRPPGSFGTVAAFAGVRCGPYCGEAPELSLLGRMTPTASIVLCRNLTVRAPERVMVSDLSLSVAPGEVVVLMGPSGAGKSVLADVLFGLIGGDGPAWVAGVALEGEVGEAAEKGALVPQFGGGLDHLWDWENVALARPVGDRGRPAGAKDVRAHSGGERRRVLIDRGVAAGRSLLWLDEPAAGLDLGRTRALAAELRGLAAAGLALVVTTHRLDLASAVADRVLWMGTGGNVETFPGAPAVSNTVDIVDAPGVDGAALEAWVSARVDAGSAGASALATGLGPARVSYGLGIGVWACLAAWGGVAHMRSMGATARRGAAATLRLVLARGAVFQAVVGAITAAIIYFSVRGSGGLTSAVAWIPPLGMTIVLRVSQPLAAILASASSGAAVSSWVGQQVARRELQGLEVLRVDTRAAFLSPVLFALAGSVFAHTMLFALAMMTAFAAFILFLSDAPSPALAAYFGSMSAWLRPDSVALWLPKLLLYPMLVAGVTVAFASLPKPSTASVGEALTRGIVRATLAVVLIELVLLLPQALG